MKAKNCVSCGAEFVPKGARSAVCSVACLLIQKTVRDDVTGCLEWTGALGSHGYGTLFFDGAFQTAHRAAYQLAYGSVAGGLYVMHRCDNRKCCAFEHLVVGTPRDNSMDMIQKGHHYSKGRGITEAHRRNIIAAKKRYYAAKLAEAMRTDAV